MRDALREIDVLLEECKRRESSFIPDGAVNIDRYVASVPRILWILKEPNGPGDWDLRKYFRDELFKYQRWFSTAGLMIKVSHGLLNSCLDWGDWANSPRSLADCLRDVAIININKRGGDSIAKWAPLEKAGIDFANLIAAQISAHRPEVVILAGSSPFLPSSLRAKLGALESSEAHATMCDGAVFIRAFHPNQKTISHKKYYNQVVAAVAKHNPSLRRRT